VSRGAPGPSTHRVRPRSRWKTDAVPRRPAGAAGRAFARSLTRAGAPDAAVVTRSERPETTPPLVGFPRDVGRPVLPFPPPDVLALAVSGRTRSRVPPAALGARLARAFAFHFSGALPSALLAPSASARGAPSTPRCIPFVPSRGRRTRTGAAPSSRSRRDGGEPPGSGRSLRALGARPAPDRAAEAKPLVPRAAATLAAGGVAAVLSVACGRGRRRASRTASRADLVGVAIRRGRGRRSAPFDRRLHGRGRAARFRDCAVHTESLSARLRRASPIRVARRGDPAQNRRPRRRGRGIRAILAAEFRLEVIPVVSV
jgi:hypothetical protein